MKLEAVAQPRIVGAALDLVERVRLERIHPAEGAEPVGILRRLLGGPVVLGAHFRVLVLDDA